MLIRKALLLVASIPTFAYAQCLNVNDFNCFLNKYAVSDPSVNCDGSTSPPVLNVNDFQCFVNLYAAGDPRADCDGSCQSTGHTWYVSMFGNDSGAGNLAQPFQTAQRAEAAALPGDTVLFKRGDTWTVGITLNKNGIVWDAYGTGARPSFSVAGTAFYSTGVNDRVWRNLNVRAAQPATGSAGFCLFTPSSRNRIENCYIEGFAVNVVLEETQTPVRATGNVLSHCVIVDSLEPGPGHSQGVFFGNQDNWVIDSCVLDRNAINKADIFSHNSYVHETCGSGMFTNNITARACSHGVQQRPGGVMENNLALANAINLFQGPAVGNICRWNVCLDSKDINSVDRRGNGFVLYGGAGSVIEHNIAAHQVHGTESIDGFDLSNWNGSSVYDNVCWDWDGPNAGNPGWATAWHIEAGSFNSNPSCARNVIVHHGNGMIWRFERPATGVYADGFYYTATGDGGVGGYSRFATDAGVGATLAQWRAATGDPSVFAAKPPPAKNGTIAAYLAYLGLAGDLPEFMDLARAGDPRATADAVNDWERALFGVQPN